MHDNIILLTDSYKLSHVKQYPPGTSNVYSYFESRGGKFDEIVFFGLQYFLQKYLSKPITQEDIAQAKNLADRHMGGEFNEMGWHHILYKHGGKLPVSIKAVPEGTVVPPGHVLMTIENTDPDCFWLTNYLETLLVQVWYPCTVATVSREMKKIIHKGLEETGDPEGIRFKLHDFGFRGVETVESAGIGGCAHLVNFQGTDTIAALEVAEKVYNETMAGFYIRASEHSTITSWGREDEVKAFENMLDQWPTGLVACVSDSFNIYNACADLWGTQLKDKILSRDGTLVVRPDSGDPLEVLPRMMGLLANKLGYTVNKKGYKVLDPHVRVIQGDGINLKSLQEIVNCLQEHHWSIDNIAFGSGGGLLQQVNRDTCKFAFKCSEVTVNGQPRDVYKQPVGCPWKVSKKGRLKLQLQNDGFHTVSSSGLPHFNFANDLLVEVYRDGEILVNHDLKDIRERAAL